ncbi:MAG: DUF1640 domain-containing protein, partial [Halorhodospira sp.]
SHVRESELRLQKEIEQLRAELKTDIEQLRSDTHAMDGRLTKEIEQLRADSRTEIAHAKVDIIKWTAGMLAVQLALIGAIAKWLAG